MTRGSGSRAPGPGSWGSVSRLWHRDPAPRPLSMAGLSPEPEVMTVRTPWYRIKALASPSAGVYGDRKQNTMSPLLRVCHTHLPFHPPSAPSSWAALHPRRPQPTFSPNSISPATLLPLMSHWPPAPRGAAAPSLPICPPALPPISLAPWKRGFQSEPGLGEGWGLGSCGSLGVAAPSPFPILSCQLQNALFPGQPRQPWSA